MPRAPRPTRRQQQRLDAQNLLDFAQAFGHVPLDDNGNGAAPLPGAPPPAQQQRGRRAERGGEGTSTGRAVASPHGAAMFPSVASPPLPASRQRQNENPNPTLTPRAGARAQVEP